MTPAHFRNVSVRLKRTLAALGAERVDDLRPLIVIRYRNKLSRDGLSNRSANLVVDSLRTMLTWASDCEIVEKNPLSRIRRLPDGPGHQRCVRRALSEDEIRHFLTASEADDHDTAQTWQTKGGGKRNHRRSTVRGTCTHAADSAGLLNSQAPGWQPRSRAGRAAAASTR